MAGLLAQQPSGLPNGMLAAGNIDLNNRPVVHNPDGSISTVRSIGVEFDGKHYLLPTVSPDGKILNDDAAIDLFRNTGQHLGVFDNQDAADAYGQSLHEQQAQQYLPQSGLLNVQPK
jgi:hypothetical protein